MMCLNYKDNYREISVRVTGVARRMGSDVLGRWLAWRNLGYLNSQIKRPEMKQVFARDFRETFIVSAKTSFT